MLDNMSQAKRWKVLEAGPSKNKGKSEFWTSRHLDLRLTSPSRSSGVGQQHDEACDFVFSQIPLLCGPEHMEKVLLCVKPELTCYGREGSGTNVMAGGFGEGRSKRTKKAM